MLALNCRQKKPALREELAKLLKQQMSSGISTGLSGHISQTNLNNVLIFKALQILGNTFWLH